MISPANPGTSVPSAGIAGAPGQVKRPGVSGNVAVPLGSFSAKELMSPRAISSSWLCMVVAVLSRSCTMACSEPDTVVLPPVPAVSGTPSTLMALPTVVAE